MPPPALPACGECQEGYGRKTRQLSAGCTRRLNQPGAAFRLGLLEGAGGAQHAVLGIERPDDLQPDRQPGAGQPARDARRRLARHVERIAERRPVDPMSSAAGSFRSWPTGSAGTGIIGVSSRS